MLSQWVKLHTKHAEPMSKTTQSVCKLMVKQLNNIHSMLTTWLYDVLVLEAVLEAQNVQLRQSALKVSMSIFILFVIMHMQQYNTGRMVVTPEEKYLSFCLTVTTIQNILHMQAINDTTNLHILLSESDKIAVNHLTEW